MGTEGRPFLMWQCNHQVCLWLSGMVGAKRTQWVLQEIKIYLMHEKT